jgi:hypothetical protein
VLAQSDAEPAEAAAYLDVGDVLVDRIPARGRWVARCRDWAPDGDHK